MSEVCLHHHTQHLGEQAAELDLPTPDEPPDEPPFHLVMMLDG